MTATLAGMKTSRAPLNTAIVLLFLPVLYVGSYYVLVVPDGSWRAIISSTYPTPRYRIGGVWSERIFWPLEQLDRWVRPGAWHHPWDQPDLRSGPPSNSLWLGETPHPEISRFAQGYGP